MHSYVSNRARQVLGLLDGLAQGDAALKGLLKARSQFQDSRPAKTSYSTQLKMKIDPYEVEIYIEERVSERTRWIGGRHSGQYRLLDSLHFLSQVCEGKVCWVAAAEEVFSPEPLAMGVSYLAFEEGFPTTTTKPVRSLSHLTSLPPGEWKSLVPENCVDLRARPCRLSLLENLRVRNRTAREREFRFGSLLKHFRKTPHTFPSPLEEAQVFSLMKSLDKQRTMELPELYWMAGTYERLMNFSAPGNARPEDFSVRSPQLVAANQESEQEILRRWFEVNSGGTPPKAHQETYFYNDTHALRHLARESKWDAALYSKVQEFPMEMFLDRGLALYGIRYVARCATLNPKTIQDFLALEKDFAQSQRFFRKPDCEFEADLKIEKVVKGIRVQESPMIYIADKPWISLASLWSLFAKLGGRPSGFFPDSLDKKQPDPISDEDSNNKTTGMVLIPSYP
jgi:hypothetical protein